MDERYKGPPAGWMSDMDLTVSDDDVRQLLRDVGVALVGESAVACRVIMERWDVSYNVAYDLLASASRLT